MTRLIINKNAKGPLRLLRRQKVLGEFYKESNSYFIHLTSEQFDIVKYQYSNSDDWFEFIPNQRMYKYRYPLYYAIFNIVKNKLSVTYE